MPHYPKTWSEYVGQVDAVEQLQMAIADAKSRGVQLEHILIHSRVAGVGKTALGQLVARELGVPMMLVTEPIMPSKVPFLFKKLKAGQVLFLDEVHRQFTQGGGKSKAEWLLTFLADGMIPSVSGTGERQGPPITVIAATTDVARLTDPFLTRFDMHLPLVAYTEDEARLIAMNLAVKILQEEGGGLALPSEGACRQIARASGCNPREMTRILKTLRRQVCGGNLAAPADGSYDLTKTLQMAGFTPDGLSSRAQEYLLLLHRAEGVPVGEQQLRSRLGKGDGFGELELGLVDRGLVLLTRGGRVLTDTGLDRADELAEELVHAA
jgi:Holliday junction DNA helicase RuvB